MWQERLLSTVVRSMSNHYLSLAPASEKFMPAPNPGQAYMLYMHVPFCERLCPYCSFNRFPFSAERAQPYFENLRKEMLMLADLGYDFESIYIGGGTPTIMLDELCRTIELARETFSVKEVSSETNPNHLVPEYLERLVGNVQRLSVGVQSFDDGLLKQMDRYDKYGSAEQILERIQQVEGMFTSLNVDMIFNFPLQTEEMLLHDIEMVKQSRATQTTFYPLMASPVVARSLAATVGQVDYQREKRFYEIISEGLTGGDDPRFTFGSAWTFNARLTPWKAAGSGTGAGKIPHTNVIATAQDGDALIDEYIVDYEEYPAIGSGGLTFLDGSLYVNTFSVRDYNAAIEAGHMSLMGKTVFSKRDRMRYRFMMQLFGLRLDKKRWEQDFDCTVAQGLPVENTFMKLSGAYAIDDDEEITLTPTGRYLLVAMMRQFFIGVNGVRDQARAALSGEERELIFGSGA